MNRKPTPTLTLVYLAVTLGGVLLAVIGGSAPPALITGAAIALGGGTLSALTWRRAAPFHTSRLTDHWWKFPIAGAALVGAVIVAAGIGVEAWLLGVAVVLVAIALVAVGLALGLARLLTRRSPSAA
jgi:hypothetical protein